MPGKRFISMIYVAFSDEYVLELPPGHRFPIEKYSLIPKQLLHEGTFSRDNFFAPPAVSRTLLEHIHENEFIDNVEQGRLPHREQRRIGFPWSPELVHREKIITQGSVQGAWLALKHGVAFNVAGGAHHAYPGHGEGFCIFNDIAVAARYLLDHDYASRILILNLDVHQGNGTAAIFADEPGVFTFSMYGANNYPLRKEKSDLDVPLPDYTGDNDFLSQLESYLSHLLDTVRPDIIFYQAGVDALNDDKLGKLDLSIQGLKERDRFVFQTLSRYEIPVAVSMGGGYAKQLRDIVEAHCNTYRMAEKIYED